MKIVEAMKTFLLDVLDCIAMEEPSTVMVITSKIVNMKLWLKIARMYSYLQDLQLRCFNKSVVRNEGQLVFYNHTARFKSNLKALCHKEFSKYILIF